MALELRGEYWYGTTQADIRAEILRYSKDNAHVAEHFADARCGCGHHLFELALDENAGVAVRTCVACRKPHTLADGAQHLTNANLEPCSCACDGEAFEMTIGVSVYAGSEDVRWLYVGCRCAACGMLGVYGDWKHEAGDFRTLLASI